MCVRAERVAILAIVALVGAASFGCTHAQAKVNPELPGLDVPAPPPRNVEATEELPPLPATTTEETPGPIAPARPRPPAAQQRPEPARPEPARVEPPPEPPKPADDARSQPPTTLQTAPADREAQVERNIRDRLARASAGLNRVDYRGLNGDARTQYDQAMRFISQARDALRDRNLVFANNLAEKALTLAAQLAGR
jgi:outer membrane biosynthesis protein TonB